jgi:hypothetical protein
MPSVWAEVWPVPSRSLAAAVEPLGPGNVRIGSTPYCVSNLNLGHHVCGGARTVTRSALVNVNPQPHER